MMWLKYFSFKSKFMFDSKTFIRCCLIQAIAGLVIMTAKKIIPEIIRIFAKTDCGIVPSMNFVPLSIIILKRNLSTINSASITRITAAAEKSSNLYFFKMLQYSLILYLKSISFLVFIFVA